MHKVFQISQKVIAKHLVGCQLLASQNGSVSHGTKKKEKVACVTTRRQEMSGGMNKINVNIWMFH